MPVKTKIQVRRDTAANWTSTNPTLAAGEQGWETDTKRMKVGDGTTAWTSLAYFGPTAKLKYETVTQAAVSNTTTESDLYSFSLTAANATSFYRVTTGGTLKSNAGTTTTFTFRHKISATTVFTSTAISLVNSNDTHRWQSVFTIGMAGSTSAQYCGATLVDNRGTENFTTGALAFATGYNTATEDLSSAKTVKLTVAMSQANANAFVNCNYVFVEEITE